LEFLTQGERSVEALASVTGMSVAITSQHLRQLRQDLLVAARQNGQHHLPPQLSRITRNRVVVASLRRITRIQSPSINHMGFTIMTQPNTKLLFIVTTYDADPDRTATPFVLANSALAAGSDVLMWFTLEGANLARKGATDPLIPKSFPPVAELLNAYMDNGGRIGVCPPCGKTHGVTNENMVAKAEWMGAAAVLGASQERQTFSF
jgi:predicted peroxiredoxin